MTRAFPRPRDLWKPPNGRVSDAGLRVRTLGAAPPTFVLLHGLAASMRYFGGDYDQLAHEGRLIVPDLLGFGESPHPPDGNYDADQHATAVLDCLKQVSARGPLCLVGHSAGTLVALRVARLLEGAMEDARREGGGRIAEITVEKVIAISPPLYASSDVARRKITELGWYLRLFATDTVAARLICRFMCRHPERAAQWFGRLRPDLPPAVTRDATSHTWESYSRTLKNLVFANPGPEDLRALKAPIELIVGDRDEIVDHDYLKCLAQEGDNVRLQIWQADHELPLTQPARLAKFLAGQRG